MKTEYFLAFLTFFIVNTSCDQPEERYAELNTNLKNSVFNNIHPFIHEEKMFRVLEENYKLFHKMESVFKRQAPYNNKIKQKFYIFMEFFKVLKYLPDEFLSKDNFTLYNTTYYCYRSNDDLMKNLLNITNLNSENWIINAEKLRNFFNNQTQCIKNLNINMEDTCRDIKYYKKNMAACHAELLETDSQYTAPGGVLGIYRGLYSIEEAVHIKKLSTFPEIFFACVDVTSDLQAIACLRDGFFTYRDPNYCLSKNLNFKSQETLFKCLDASMSKALELEGKRCTNEKNRIVINESPVYTTNHYIETYNFIVEFHDHFNIQISNTVGTDLNIRRICNLISTMVRDGVYDFYSDRYLNTTDSFTKSFDSPYYYGEMSYLLSTEITKTANESLSTGNFTYFAISPHIAYTNSNVFFKSYLYGLSLLTKNSSLYRQIFSEVAVDYKYVITNSDIYSLFPNLNLDYK